MVTLQQRAEEEGLNALEILDSIRTRTGGWFDCECNRCINEGNDCHAWDAFEGRATDAIHYAILAQAEQDALLAVLIPEAVAIGQQLARDLETERVRRIEAETGWETALTERSEAISALAHRRGYLPYALETTVQRLERQVASWPKRKYLETDHPDVVRCMNSVEACAAGGCQARITPSRDVEHLRTQITALRVLAVRRMADTRAATLAEVLAMFPVTA